MDFVSSPSPNSTNEVPSDFGVSTASPQVSTTNLSDATVYAILANQPNRSQLVHEDLEQIHEDDLEEIDLKWQLALLSMRTKRFFHKTGKKITINGSDTAGNDKSKVVCFNYHKLGHFLRECKGTRNQENKTRKQETTRRTMNVEDTSSKAMDTKIEDSELVVLKSKLEKISNEKDALETKILKFENASQSLDKLIGSQVTDNKNNGAPLIEDWESNEEDEVESPPEKERKIVKRSVDKIEVEIPKQNNKPARLGENTIRGKGWRATYNTRNFLKKVNTAKEAVNTARLNSVVLNAIRENKGKAGHSHKQMEDQGYFDSRCSWHMTRNIFYLTDFKEFDGGYVTFRGGAKGVGTFFTGSGNFFWQWELHNWQWECLVYFIPNMNNKNCVLFTDTECFVLSHDFKLADESYVLLKIPRKNNMYSANMKNIVPKKDLTCLVVKATNDESMLWHRRLDKKVKIIRCDNGKEFKNRVMNEFCEEKCIKREYSVARTPQQNGVAERRNMTLIKAVRTMLADSKLPITFWAKAVNTAYYVKNMVLVVKPHFKTSYELLRGRTSALSFMRPFRCHVTILNTLDHLGKFDGKSDKGFFVGYCTNSKAFRVYSTRTRKVEENLHIKFLENKPLIISNGPKWLFDIDTLTESMNYVPVIAGTNSNDFVGKGASFDIGQSSMEARPSQDYILMSLWNNGLLFDSSPKDSDGDNQDDDGPNTKSEIYNQERPNAENSTKDVNTIRPSINTASSNINTASPTVSTVRLSKDFFGTDNDMRSLDGVELDIRNISTTYVVPTTPNTRIHKDHSLDNVIGDIQFGVFRNKKDERGIVVRNKARLVAQGCTQEEGIDYDEVFSLVIRIKAIRLFLLYASFMGFLVYQIDVKRALLYGRIKEEVYVYARLIKLYSSRDKKDILLVQVYVDDIIFGSTKKELCIKFEVLMHDKFQMSLMGELTLFLGLQVMHKSDGIFISQAKYVDEILRKFMYNDVKPANTSMDKENALLKDSDGDDVDVHLYRSMIESLMYLTSSRPYIMFDICTYEKFQCKKQTVVATSTIGAEYVAAASCCGQHNMVAVLKKPQGSKDFHQIVDFLKASHIRKIELNATVDGHDKTITEASVRRHLKLADADGISTLPTTKIFEQLALIGYVTDSDKLTFQKGPTSPVRTQHTPTIIESSLHLQNISITYSKTRTRTRRIDIRIPQSNVPSSVANKAITKEMHDGLGRATTTASSLGSEQGSEATSLDHEDSPKQGRMIEEINKYKNVNLVKSSKQRAKHRMDFSTGSPQTNDDETLAETLLNIKRSAAKDNRKAIMQESESPKKIKKKEMMQISLDEEVAQRFYEEEQA
uniref:Ribonuclease H-like domain-containing protein n=1 Tax=Tanacetum cinerariifolium TaxID=118510 RepID=A0A699GHT2_TANCI|nr:ribonuclease H-like domain-containing protein [Tanacetum cinerariifolium]